MLNIQEVNKQVIVVILETPIKVVTCSNVAVISARLSTLHQQLQANN